MSVIGRLDDQVDAVIIAPVAKRRAEEGAGRDDAAEDSRPEQTAAPEATPAPERGKDQREAAGPTGRGTLPVWLL